MDFSQSNGNQVPEFLKCKLPFIQLVFSGGFSKLRSSGLVSWRFLMYWERIKCVGFHHLDYPCCQQEKLLKVIIAIIRSFPLLFFFFPRQSFANLQRNEIHADKKIKEHLNCHHLWPMENSQAIYSTGNNCKIWIKILATSWVPGVILATCAYKQ